MENTDKTKRTVCVSEEAYHEIKRRIADNPELYQSRGAVGVIDQLLFNKFTRRGRGNLSKNPVDKK